MLPRLQQSSLELEGYCKHTNDHICQGQVCNEVVRNGLKVNHFIFTCKIVGSTMVQDVIRILFSLCAPQNDFYEIICKLPNYFPSSQYEKDSLQLQHVGEI